MLYTLMREAKYGGHIGLEVIFNTLATVMRITHARAFCIEAFKIEVSRLQLQHSM